MNLPFFYHASPITEQRVSLDEASSRHIAQVLRMQAGEALHLTDGLGTLYTAVIALAHKRNTEVNITEKVVQARHGRSVSIAISLLKNRARFEWFLEKATELGVQHIYVMRCERSEKEQVRSERLQQILTSAMLQSKQCWLPVLHGPASFTETIESIGVYQKLIAHCAPEAKKDDLGTMKLSNEVALFIGPEGDFTSAEIDQSLKAGYQPVALGENRLRTETAGVAAATLLCLR